MLAAVVLLQEKQFHVACDPSELGIRRGEQPWLGGWSQGPTLTGTLSGLVVEGFLGVSYRKDCLVQEPGWPRGCRLQPVLLSSSRICAVSRSESRRAERGVGERLRVACVRMGGGESLGLGGKRLGWPGACPFTSSDLGRIGVLMSFLLWCKKSEKPA